MEHDPRPLHLTPTSRSVEARVVSASATGWETLSVIDILLLLVALAAAGAAIAAASPPAARGIRAP